MRKLLNSSNFYKSSRRKVFEEYAKLFQAKRLQLERLQAKKLKEKEGIVQIILWYTYGLWQSKHQIQKELKSEKDKVSYSLKLQLDFCKRY